MDLGHLRYFQTIAACGSMTAAAKVLGVSQPTLTVAMRNLEEKLETTLLLRERTGVRLTSTGTELLRRATEIFALLQRTESEIRGLETDDRGSFVIGTHESLGAYFLPTFMASFLHRAPRIELSLWNGSSAAVERAVLDRDVHFGIVVNAHRHDDLVVVDLFHDAVDLFVASDAELSPTSQRLRRGEVASSTRTTEQARELLRAGPLIFAGRVEQCRELLERLAATEVLPARMLSCGDFELVKSLALAGIGVAMLPRRVAAYGQEGKLSRLHPALPSFPDTISLIYRADMHRTSAGLRVKDALAAHGKQLDKMT